MFADKLERQFGMTWKDALKRLGITALTLPLVAFIGVILLFLVAVVGWVAHGSRCCALMKGIQNPLNLPDLRDSRKSAHASKSCAASGL